MSSKRLLTSTSFVAPIATSFRLKTDTPVEDKKYSTTGVPMGSVNIIPTFKENSNALKGRTDFENEGIPRKGRPNEA